MAKREHPKTLAIRTLLKFGIEFEVHSYAYEPRGGTSVSSLALGVDERSVIKTLIMETDSKAPLIMLMHGDNEVSVKQLARVLNVKSVRPCEPKVADRHSGYQVGGTSPFGTRKAMPVYMEQSILDLEKIFINQCHDLYGRTCICLFTQHGHDLWCGHESGGCADSRPALLPLLPEIPSRPSWGI